MFSKCNFVMDDFRLIIYPLFSRLRAAILSEKRVSHFLKCVIKRYYERITHRKANSLKNKNYSVKLKKTLCRADRAETAGLL